MIKKNNHSKEIFGITLFLIIISLVILSFSNHSNSNEIHEKEMISQKDTIQQEEVQNPPTFENSPNIPKEETLNQEVKVFEEQEIILIEQFSTYQLKVQQDKGDKIDILLNDKQVFSSEQYPKKEEIIDITKEFKKTNTLEIVFTHNGDNPPIIVEVLGDNKETIKFWTTSENSGKQILQIEQ
jgi:preprotein translocase subunit SecF